MTEGSKPVRSNHFEEFVESSIANILRKLTTYDNLFVQLLNTLYRIDNNMRERDAISETVLILQKEVGSLKNELSVMKREHQKIIDMLSKSEEEDETPIEYSKQMAASRMLAFLNGGGQCLHEPRGMGLWNPFPPPAYASVLKMHEEENHEVIEEVKEENKVSNDSG
jgi:hypothetical protein